MRRFVIVLLACLAVIVSANAKDVSSIINTLGFIDGYESYLNTGIFSPPSSSQRSADYINNYHDGYFRAVEEYNAGYDVGFALGQYHHRKGWPKSSSPILGGSLVSDGSTVAVMKGLKVGYDDGYAKSLEPTSLTSSSDTVAAGTSLAGERTGSLDDYYSYTTDTTQSETLGSSTTGTTSGTPDSMLLYEAISKNQDLQTVLTKMQNVNHNDRCAEGVMSILSALLGDDIRKYNNWSQLQMHDGFPLIYSQDMLNMLGNCGLFKEVDPNSPPKPFRVLDIQYTGGLGGHNEIFGSDGNWYSDGREYPGAVLYDSSPKTVRAFDLDIPAYLNYIKSHADANPNYTQPFPGFFDTDPNSAPHNDILSLYYGY